VTATPAPFGAGALLVSRSVYFGDTSTVTVGQTLPGGGIAVADGTYPHVFDNAKPDPSFGVTSPIYLDQYAVVGTTATRVSTLPVPADAVVTSFPSKSEVSLHLSTDGQYVTFMGYVSPVNALDVSNSNTPGHVDPTNPVAAVNQRAVAQVDPYGSIRVTPVNTYSGNNGRAAILDSAHNQYFLAGNAGNGSGTQPTFIVDNTGVQIATPGGDPETIVVGQQQGTPGSATGFQFGYSVTQYGFPADKSGKDDNFRGLTIFEGTLYVTKGSGSNGINTVFQVGLAGQLPTAASASSTAITILPGLPTVLAKNSSAANPFGIWFANATTLYVADEGNGNPGASPNAGLQKWVLASGAWQKVYTLQDGLALGQTYSVDGLPSSFFPATGGLRNLTGRVNGDGTVTLYAITSTTSSSGDQGADPNRLVTITDTLAFMSAVDASAEQFTTLATAAAGEVLRGVSLAPTDKVAPQLTLALSPTVLWPPDNQMVPITATITATDNLDPNPIVKLESIACSDCADVGADVSAQLGQDSRTFSVRAARNGTSTAGRVYTVTYSATDASGNVTTQQATILVPHDQRASGT